MIRLTFDFPDPVVARRRVFTDPVDVVIARCVADVRPALRAIEQATARGLTAAGYIAYEAAPAFERAFRVRSGNRPPLLWFGLFDREASAAHFTAEPSTLGLIEPPALDRFAAGVATIREAIADGRTYQVNFTTRMHAAAPADVPALYESLRAAQGSGLHALLELGDFSILSLSPELFFDRQGERVTTRPMKGTSARGRWNAEDEQRAHALQHSVKERAENLMIVDLLRNDLGRIARVGTVEVPRLFDVERFRTVLQMTSTVTASVASQTTLTELLEALFPCGSVTGAPKISTMQIIAELEESPREVYCGAIGIVEPNGDCRFNVPIRTLWIDHATSIAEYGVGGGITWDSVAGSEYQEILDKAAVLREAWPAFELFETMRLESGHIPRLALHLSRLRQSCVYFDYPWCDSLIDAAIAALCEPSADSPMRVRLLIARDGTVRTTCDPLQHDPDVVQRVALATEPVDSSDRFLFHKTTNRAVYDRHLAMHPDRFDVLLWNERQELTEFTRGNVVIELNRKLFTPLRTAGLLAGTFREELLLARTIEERAVSVSELGSAQRVWLINSLREWVEVRF